MKNARSAKLWKKPTLPISSAVGYMLFFHYFQREQFYVIILFFLYYCYIFYVIMTSRFDSILTAVEQVICPPDSFSGSLTVPGFKTLLWQSILISLTQPVPLLLTLHVV